MIRPRVRSYGDSSIVTLSPGRMRMKCMRILPEMWASTWWPFSSFTRNIALGRGSTTVPSTWTPSSFATRGRSPLHGARTRREDLGSRPPHRDGVLEVRAPAPVPRHHRPAVALRVHLGATDVDHGLDGQHLPHGQFETPSRPPVIGDLRVLVQLAADAVADQVAHHAEARGLDVALHRMADVAD